MATSTAAEVRAAFSACLGNRAHAFRNMQHTRKEMHPSRIYVFKRIRLRREGVVSDADRSSRKGEFHAARTDQRRGLRRRRLRADQRSVQRGDRVPQGG